MALLPVNSIRLKAHLMDLQRHSSSGVLLRNNHLQDSTATELPRVRHRDTVHHQVNTDHLQCQVQAMISGNDVPRTCHERQTTYVRR